MTYTASAEGVSLAVARRVCRDAILGSGPHGVVVTEEEVDGTLRLRAVGPGASTPPWSLSIDITPSVRGRSGGRGTTTSSGSELSDSCEIAATFVGSPPGPPTHDEERYTALACARRAERIESLQHRLGTSSLALPRKALGNATARSILASLFSGSDFHWIRRGAIRGMDLGLISTEAAEAVELLAGTGMVRITDTAQDGTAARIEVGPGPSTELVAAVAASVGTGSDWTDRVHGVRMFAPPAGEAVMAIAHGDLTSPEDLAGWARAESTESVEEDPRWLLASGLVVQGADGRLRFANQVGPMALAAEQLPAPEAAECAGRELADLFRDEAAWVRAFLEMPREPFVRGDASGWARRAETLRQAIGTLRFAVHEQAMREVAAESLERAARLDPVTWGWAAIQVRAEQARWLERCGQPDAMTGALDALATLAAAVAPYGGVDPITAIGVYFTMTSAEAGSPVKGGDRERTRSRALECLDQWASASLDGPRQDVGNHLS